MTEDEPNQDTVVPTILEGVGVRVVAGREHIHLARSDGAALGAFNPAQARLLAALLLGASYALDKAGTHNDMELLIDKVRKHDSELCALRAMPAGSAKH